MTLLQTPTYRTVILTRTQSKEPRKMSDLLEKLGLLQKGNNTSRLSEEHDEVLYK